MHIYEKQPQQKSKEEFRNNDFLLFFILTITSVYEACSLSDTTLNALSTASNLILPKLHEVGMIIIPT